MLFDLFACIDTQHRKTGCQNPFPEIDAYKKLMYADQESVSDNFYMVSLHKRHDDNFPVFQDDQWDIRIFGYCFPRTNSTTLKDKTRLSANRIAQIYKEHGKDFLQDIKGSFAIFIYNKEKKELQVFTDPLNVRPVYYCQLGAKILVSTSLSAIVSYKHSQQLANPLNYRAILEYYLFEYVLNEDTYLKDVFTVPPGGRLLFNEEDLTVQQYWSVFEAFDKFDITYVEEKRAIDKLEIILKKNLDLYLFDPDRTAIALTGGYDSRTNLALLGNKSKDHLFYSYGIEKTYDLSIPKKIAKTLNLRFKEIQLEDQYLRNFNKNAAMAIGLGDGIAEANRTNYLFAFKELGKSYDYILTGLFGSELIKHPTSVGDFINQDMKDLLESDRPEQLIDEILDRAEKKGHIEKTIFQQYREEVKQSVLNHPFIVNKHSQPIKYFYFLLMVGIRKYFMKELKVEKPFVENLHPFFDLEFIETLLKTPFPWIHHWEGKKDLMKGMKTHKFYVNIIERNKPKLNSILSTHGYTPKYLLNKFLMPFMALEYMYYKKKIRAHGSFHSLNPTEQFFEQAKDGTGKVDFLSDSYLQEKQDSKNVIKLNSLKFWLNKNKLS